MVIFISILECVFFSRLKCKRCVNNIQTEPPPDNTDCTSHLSQWYHCSNNRGLPDNNLSEAWRTSKCISFVFHHRSQGEVKKSTSDIIVEEKRDADSIDQQKDCKKYKKSRKISSGDEDDDYKEPDDSKDSDFE